jgi:hypothetical protein
MGIKGQLVRIISSLCILLLVSTPPLLATTTDYGLTVSPEKCFVVNQTKQCKLSVKLDWRTPSNGEYCIFVSNSSSALHCWKKQNIGSLVHLVESRSDLVFELKSSVNNQTLFSAKFKLFKQTTGLTKRRRNPWSFY